ncbi:MAG: hypothetical protein COS35_06525 [Zetaproteobacteria bacterium CG02_land_8_20_14_3_00_50_9]|nr:MAG: hypothetical protein COS35_06525 [Zetaproteobacteria bacterium CG02_land_8_20_14_3_00_50_9]
MAKRTNQPQRQQARQIDVGLVICSIDPATLAEDNSQRIHLIPVNADGMVVGFDGRKWKYNGANIIANAAGMKVHLPGDYHHASLDAQKTGAVAPASGWVDPATLTDEADGIWGAVEWTPNAAAAIRNHEFKYTSPVFTAHKVSGETLALKGFALTHYPNLGDLTPVANAQLEDKSMDELLERIKYLLNLPELATPEEILAELEKAVARLSAAISSEGSEEANAQANNDNNLIDLLSHLESHVATLAANSQQDLTGYVPRGEFDRLRIELKTITTERESNRVELAVNSALDAGLIAPKSKAWAEGYCRRDPQGFADFCANAQKVVPLGEDPAPATAGAQALSEEELAICSQLGISQDEFLKTKQAQEV